MRLVWGRVWVAVVPIALIALLVLPVAASAAPKGVIATFGSAGSGPGQFSNAANGLRALAVDQASGDVYVVDGGNHRVQRFTGSGAFVSQLGSGSVGTAGGLFNSPFGVGVDPADGSVYVTDGGNLRVQKFSSSGSFIRAFGFDTIAAVGPPPNSNGTAFEVCDATALVPNLPGDCKAGTNGTGDGQFGTTFYGSPAVDPTTGSVYVADPGGTSARRIQRFNGSTGAYEGKWGGQGTGLGQFGGTSAVGAAPTRLAVDSAGAVYAVDVNASSGTARVQKCVPSGVAPSVTATCTLFASYPAWQVPVAVAINPADGHVFIARRNGIGGPGLPPDPNAPVVIEEFAAVGGPVLETHGAPGFGAGVTAANMNQSAGLAVNGSTGAIYLSVPSETAPRVYVLDDVPEGSGTVGEATEVGASSATLHATVTPAATGPTGVATGARFEYSANGVDWESTPSVELGNGSGAGDPDSCPAGNPPSCEISQQIGGLIASQEYLVRLVLTTEFGGSSVTIPGGSFTTVGAAPGASTGLALWSSPAETDPTLLLTGTVDPKNDRTSYRFEYVSDAEFAESGYDVAATVPAVDGEAGHGKIDKSVQESVSGLDPTVAYHYRLVATNRSGTTLGDDRTIDPPDPDDRFYELVSNGDSWGAGVRELPISVASDGDRVQFAAQALGSPDSVPGTTNSYTADRSDDGWGVRAALPAPALTSAIGFSGLQYASSDLETAVWGEASLDQRHRAEVQWTRIDLDGNRQPLGGLMAPIDFQGEINRGVEYNLAGAAKDLSTFAFTYTTNLFVPRFFLEEPVYAANQGPLYQMTGTDENARLSIVNRATNPSSDTPGALIGGTCGAGLGGTILRSTRMTGTRAVSGDGRVVYFSAVPDAAGDCGAAVAAGKRLYKRVDSETTVEVSASRCTRVSPACVDVGADDYQGASVDGSVAAFVSTRQLADSDLDTGAACTAIVGVPGCDVYVYDSDPPAGEPNLVQASAGEDVPGHSVGVGAGVSTVLDVSADGSRVYFAATGVLTGANSRGAAPVAGQANVYAFERDDAHPQGRLEYVAALLPTGDVINPVLTSTFRNQWALPVDDGHGDGDGRFLLFVSAAPLLSEDTDSAKDLYRYDDVTGELLCLSCAGDAAEDVLIPTRSVVPSMPNAEQEGRFTSADVSSVVFATAEQLTADDDNSRQDVYLWRDGELSLVSGGTGSSGVIVGAGLGSVPPLGISPDGSTVYFATLAPLVVSDVNRQSDFYAARVGGGFPAGATAAAPCDSLADGCRGGEAPGAESDRRTATPGSGNAVAGERGRLTLAAVGGAARRRAARTGVLAVRLGSDRAGVVRLVARARLGGRSRVVGRVSKRLARPGRSVVRLRLSRAARRRLGDGRALAVQVRLTASGMRARSMTVRLAGGRS